MLPTLQVKDNFLSEKEFNILTSSLGEITYTQAMNNLHGNYGFKCEFAPDAGNEWLFTKIKKIFFPNTNLKTMGCAYHLRHNHKKVLSHVDESDYNFILYLKGRKLVFNGTGLYYKNELNTYVGFVENRAIFFNGKDTVHSDLQALGESSFRHSINIFYNNDN